jgi:hypothetical protein
MLYPPALVPSSIYDSFLAFSLLAKRAYIQAKFDQEEKGSDTLLRDSGQLPK